MTLKRSEAIANLLRARTHPDLASLYHSGMEVQVNVSQDDGERVDGDYKGRIWHGWRDQFGNVWKPFRIPHNAKTVPEDNDYVIKFDLAQHAEGIGMTGWNWRERLSLWVAFDFDAITGHSEKHEKRLTDAQLAEVQSKVEAIPWVTIRRSKSGSGLHLYVHLSPVHTQNHTEHAALARSILGQMAGLTGFDLQGKVDASGGNMWVWHRQMNPTTGFTLVRPGSILESVPLNWKDHLSVVSGRAKRSVPSHITDASGMRDDVERMWEELTAAKSRVPLDAEHQKLIKFLHDGNARSWWDQDNHMLVTHTVHLKEAHEKLGMRGMFETSARGTEYGQDHNCFSGEVEVLTPAGPRSLRELSSRGCATLYVRTERGMEWLECKMRSFGKQVTFPIVFGDGSILRATYNHMWIDRRTGDRIPTHAISERKTELPLVTRELPEVDWEGYAHGFVFGDGWYKKNRDRDTCEVALFKHDVDLQRLLCRFGEPGTQFYAGHGYVPMVRQLPADWKHLPVDPTPAYSLGFVLGLASADGNVSKRVQIFQSDYEVLKTVKGMAIHCGLRPLSIRPYGQLGSGYENAKQGYALTITTHNLRREMFLRRDQREAFESRSKQKAMTVLAIGWDQPVEEEVFCAVVPHYQNFTLANGVLTGNCFSYPMRRGAWVVRRYTPGVAEAPTWDQDGNGWTRAYLNREPDLASASRSFGGVEHKSGGYVFREAEVGVKATSMIGVHPKIPGYMSTRSMRVKEHRDGKVLVELDHETRDRPQDMDGWHAEKGKWTRIYSVSGAAASAEPELGNFDDMVRHLITETGDDYGWLLKTEGHWRTEPLVHVRTMLGSFNMKASEVSRVLGSCIAKPWRLVCRPFQPEVVGNRDWNRRAPQLAVVPTQSDNLSYETWLSVLNHVGAGLDAAVRSNPWAKANGVLTGADYLKVWIASLFKEPLEPLPYLFFYSPEQNTGKSIFHEALSLLMTSGVVRADNALISPSGFNGELEGAVLCVIEETDMRKNKGAYNRIKDWVTSRQLPIHKKNQTPYSVPNTTHWVHAGNVYQECPVLPGDSRITMIQVSPLDPARLVPKKEMLVRLQKEAADFLAAVLALELPPSGDRLNVPVISTGLKRHAEKANQTHLEIFIEDHCHHVPGKTILFSEFHAKFQEWVDTDQLRVWTKIKMGRELPERFPKGRDRSTNQVKIGNISWTPRGPDEQVLPELVLLDEHLEPKHVRKAGA